MPTNLVYPLISSASLNTPLPPSASSPHPALLSSYPAPLPKNPEALVAAVEAITKLYAEAKNPVVLVDAIAERLGVEELVMELVEATGMTVFVSPMGKGTIDENYKRFGGVSTFPAVLSAAEKPEKSKLMLTFSRSTLEM